MQVKTASGPIHGQIVGPIHSPYFSQAPAARPAYFSPTYLRLDVRPSENLPPPQGRKEHRSPSPGQLDLRIRPRGFPAMPDPIPAPKVNSDSQYSQFSMISVWPGNNTFQHFCARGGVEVFGRPHVIQTKRGETKHSKENKKTVEDCWSSPSGKSDLGFFCFLCSPTRPH